VRISPPLFVLHLFIAASPLWLASALFSPHPDSLVIRPSIGFYFLDHTLEVRRTVQRSDVLEIQFGVRDHTVPPGFSFHGSVPEHSLFCPTRAFSTFPLPGRLLPSTPPTPSHPFHSSPSISLLSLLSLPIPSLPSKLIANCCGTRRGPKTGEDENQGKMTNHEDENALCDADPEPAVLGEAAI
jgi:hypothetical protein